jgi:murein L,D-transpeptidase YcbB/YkuD
MDARRVAAWLIGLGLVGLAPLSLLHADEVDTPDLAVEAPLVPLAEAPRPLPVADVGRALDPVTDGYALRLATAEPDSAGLDLPAPDLPSAVTLAAPLTRDPVRTGSIELGALGLPAISLAAPVVITQSDLMVPAIELRLVDLKSPLLPRLTKRDGEGLLAFYAARRFAPLWIENGALSARAARVAERLSLADEDALDARDYPALSVVGATAADLADVELKLSAAALLYARDARGGRLDPSRLSAMLTPTLDLPAPALVLTRLADAPDAGAALHGFNPAHAGYQALRAKLGTLRANRPAMPMARLPAGTVVSVRSGTALVGLGSSTRLEGDVVANMERWRWLPAEMGERHIAVNVPEFRLRVREGGRVIHETRVITGKPETPTPIFSGLMDHAVVNPSWHIPPSILKNEFLPKMASDPGYAERRGFEVVRRGKSISIRQPPGERNALGFIKFMFPNNHAVYLHDTPNRSLFSAERRAFSHGCVRVEQPFQLADVVLGQAWSETRLRGLIGRGERTIHLPKKLPVHLTYFTTEVDAFGEVRSFEDLYGYNRRVRLALGLGA